MSDIPEWLVELAAQQGDEHEGTEEAGAPKPEEDSPPEVAAPESEAPVVEVPEAPVVIEEPVAPEEPDLVSALRSQVEVDVPSPMEPVATVKSPALRIPGLVPWQQFVLALLLFLDVVVIGLLILVMLGRVSFP